MSQIEAILSDADGTLVDTVELIRRGQYETSRLYLTKHGIQPSHIPDYENYSLALNQVVGSSARSTLESTLRLLYNTNPEHLDGINYDELHALLNPTQDKLALDLVRPYPGLAETLFALGERGVKLAIFTSGTPHHIVRNFSAALPELETDRLATGTLSDERVRLEEFKQILARHFGLPAFEVVTCNDTHTHKPDPEGLNLAMRRLGVTAAKSLVLGDHTVDMQAATNAGVEQRVGITHGFDDRATLTSAGATTTIDSLSELADLLR
jgi:phosphoglycolate phosphatase-like HAD superfamily hydrolase